jgi:hypothetical protein
MLSNSNLFKSKSVLPSDIDITRDLKQIPELKQAIQTSDNMRDQFKEESITLTFTSKEAKTSFYEKIKELEKVKDLLVFIRGDDSELIVKVKLKMINEGKGIADAITLLKELCPAQQATLRQG